jgi:mannosyltransferase OCH1-like enzyme
MTNKIIIQTSKTSPDQYVVDKILKFGSGWNYVHFTDSDIYRYFDLYPIKEFSKIKEKFSLIKGGPHKADLFRYYYLYLNGGVFIDSDLEIKKDLNYLIGDNDFVSAVDKKNKTIFNGFLYVNKNSEIIYKCLKHIYEIDVEVLENNYTVVCNYLYNILHEDAINIKVKMYDVPDTEDPASIFDENNDTIAVHYWKHKTIPNN